MLNGIFLVFHTPSDKGIAAVFIQDKLIFLYGVCQIGQISQAAGHAEDNALSADAHQLSDHLFLPWIRVGNGCVKGDYQIKGVVLKAAKILQPPLNKGDPLQNTFLFGQFPGFIDHGLRKIKMCDLTAAFGKEDGESSAACAAVEHGLYAVQMREQFLFNVAFLNDIVHKRFFPAAFQLALVGQIPKPLGYFGAVVHKVPPFLISGFR